MREVTREEIKSYNPKSGGESRVLYYLLKHEVSFEQEKTFDDLWGDKGQLRFDFCVHGKDHDFLIEVDGTQHRKQTRFTGKNTKRYDKMKDEYCKQNGITLYRLVYPTGSMNFLTSQIRYVLKKEGLM